ncbi:hypothetical protein Skr01_48630 [Sphaerisporangium krabiense]|nr:hypothetical protein Skr01_48630 [Sphaerisporangium krabiense]
MTPLAHDRGQARIEPAASWLCWDGHGVAGPLGLVRSLITSDETISRIVRPAPHLTFPAAVSSDY